MPSPEKIVWTWVGGALLAALGLAGCAVGPNYTGPPAPEVPNPIAYKNAEAKGPWKRAEPADKDPRGPWWEVFHDPDLNQLEAAAAANNQDLRQSVARIEQTRAQTRVVAADFFPNAQINSSNMRERSSNTEPVQKGQTIGSIGGLGGGAAGGAMGGTGATGGSGSTGGSSSIVIAQQPLTRTFNLFSERADLNWEIDLFGRVRRNYEAARATYEQQLADDQNMKLSVAANVAVGYYDLRALDAEIKVIEDTIKFRSRRALHR